MKTTDYFDHTRTRPDRAPIRVEWIEEATLRPIAERIQADGRIQRWAYVASEQRYLGIILLPDGETVHNAFFDRRFRP